MTQREYRGKHIETGEWVFGSLISDRFIVGDIVEWTDEYFNTEWWLAVDPDTVGQYTGAVDLKSQKVFVGDIVPGGDGVNGYVIYESGFCAFSVEYHKYKQLLMDYRAEMGDEFEVIGNIHDHPHLLKGEG